MVGYGFIQKLHPILQRSESLFQETVGDLKMKKTADQPCPYQDDQDRSGDHESGRHASMSEEPRTQVAACRQASEIP